MILANGIRYPSDRQTEILEGLAAELDATLTAGTPPTPETVLAACEALTAKALTGLFDAELAGLGLDAALLEQQMGEVAALMSRESLTAKVREELGEDFAAPRTLTPPHDGGRTLTKRVVPLGVLFHIAAGNVDGLPAFSVVEGLLAGNINLLKLPSADNGLSLRMLEELVKAAPALAPYVYVFDTPSEDLAALERMAALADGVVVWGGDGATQAVRQLAPAGVKLIEWGHKLSFAYATPAGVTDQALSALARHVMETRQLLCSSCQTLFLDTESREEAQALCLRLLPHLEEAAALLCADSERAELTEQLFRSGVVRVTGPGSMSHTTALDAHDGEYPLRRYTRIVEYRA